MSNTCKHSYKVGKKEKPTKVGVDNVALSKRMRALGIPMRKYGYGKWGINAKKKTK